jgi:hypothetical protein
MNQKKVIDDLPLKNLIGRKNNGKRNNSYKISSLKVERFYHPMQPTPLKV